MKRSCNTVCDILFRRLLPTSDPGITHPRASDLRSAAASTLAVMKLSQTVTESASRLTSPKCPRVLLLDRPGPRADRAAVAGATPFLLRLRDRGDRLPTVVRERRTAVVDRRAFGADAGRT